MQKTQLDFLSKTNKSSGRQIGTLSECWFFLGKTKTNGYCHYQKNTVKQLGITYAHQASYYLFKDQSYRPSRETPLRHLCEGGEAGSHRCCVNPDHLVIGSIQENIADRDNNRGKYQLKGEDVGTSKFTLEQCKAIQKRYIDGEEYAEIASALGVNRRTIERICIGKTYGLPDCRITLAKMKEELDNKIKQLLSEGKSYSEISKQVGKSASYISGVKNKK